MREVCGAQPPILRRRLESVERARECNIIFFSGKKTTKHFDSGAAENPRRNRRDDKRPTVQLCALTCATVFRVDGTRPLIAFDRFAAVRRTGRKGRAYTTGRGDGEDVDEIAQSFRRVNTVR
jgi:hypothetical protein